MCDELFSDFFRKEGIFHVLDGSLLAISSMKITYNVQLTKTAASVPSEETPCPATV